jgi:hypothetical protein
MHVRGRSDEFEAANYPPAHVNLPWPEPMTRAPRKGVVIVVPSFAERQQSYQEVVRAPVVRTKWPGTDRVTQ